jgi:peptidoglycan/xylan/chitin deacetylase (PgdA/CDA1 family)
MSNATRWPSELRTVPWGTRPFTPMMYGHATIIVMHRFADPDRGITGLDPRALRRALQFLRSERYPIVSLDRLFQGLTGEAPPIDRAVAFTMDDGTIDQATVAAPIFEEFDCPATIFVVTGYLDGALWCWWHRVEYVFETTRHREFSVMVAGLRHIIRLNDGAPRAQHARRFMDRCTRVPEVEKLRAIERLAAAAEVELPARPPARYAPMSWDDVRACEARGITFGPHTVTHPVLSRASEEQSKHEIHESWARLRAEARRPVPIFCYPNGHVGTDFGPRECATLRRLGFVGAVTSWPGDYATVGGFRSSPDAPFSVPRIDFGEDHRSFVRSVSGGLRTEHVQQQQQLALRRVVAPVVPGPMLDGSQDEAQDPSASPGE